MKRKQTRSEGFSAHDTVQRLAVALPAGGEEHLVGGRRGLHGRDSIVVEDVSEAEGILLCGGEGENKSGPRDEGEEDFEHGDVEADSRQAEDDRGGVDGERVLEEGDDIRDTVLRNANSLRLAGRSRGIKHVDESSIGTRGSRFTQLRESYRETGQRDNSRGRRRRRGEGRKKKAMGGDEDDLAGQLDAERLRLGDAQLVSDEDRALGVLEDVRLAVRGEGRVHRYIGTAC